MRIDIFLSFYNNFESERVWLRRMDINGDTLLMVVLEA
jgi:hypothetical protein